MRANRSTCQERRTLAGRWSDKRWAAPAPAKSPATSHRPYRSWGCLSHPGTWHSSLCLGVRLHLSGIDRCCCNLLANRPWEQTPGLFCREAPFSKVPSLRRGLVKPGRRAHQWQRLESQSHSRDRGESRKKRVEGAFHSHRGPKSKRHTVCPLSPPTRQVY